MLFLFVKTLLLDKNLMTIVGVRKVSFGMEKNIKSNQKAFSSMTLYDYVIRFFLLIFFVARSLAWLAYFLTILLFTCIHLFLSLYCLQCALLSFHLFPFRSRLCGILSALIECRLVKNIVEQYIVLPNDNLLKWLNARNTHNTNTKRTTWIPRHGRAQDPLRDNRGHLWKHIFIFKH